MKIQEIKIEKFPVVIISDTHCHIKRISEIKSVYPHSQFICLGDITNLFSEKEPFNKHSINYFIENKIPCIEGNHESFILACHSKNKDNKDKSTLGNVLMNVNKPPTYNLEEGHLDYLRNLPRGFKLILPDGSNYLCFHHEPNNLWNFNDKGSIEGVWFKTAYPLDDKTVGVLHGHVHKPFIEEYEGIKAKRCSIGAVKYESYAILDEEGIHFKVI